MPCRRPPGGGQHYETRLNYAKAVPNCKKLEKTPLFVYSSFHLTSAITVSHIHTSELTVKNTLRRCPAQRSNSFYTINPGLTDLQIGG
jgi:hypothetical protein